MIGDRRLDLVGRTDEHLRTLELFVHANDLGAVTAALALVLGLGRLLLGFRLDYCIADDFLVYLDHAAHQNFP